MNKLTTLISVCFLFPSFLWAQKGTLNYKYFQKTPFGTNEINYLIYFNQAKSFEVGVPKVIKESSEKISETQYVETRAIKDPKPLFILKDLQEKKLILSDVVGSHAYLINDSLNNFSWRITKEHQKILNYNCAKAMLNYRGRNYVVWFTESIPLPLGPWKFGGLPGLIIKMSDNENKFVYELTGINLKAKFDEKLLNIPQAYQADKPISHQEFMGLYNTKVKHYKKMSRVVTTGANGSYGTATVILAEKQEKF